MKRTWLKRLGYGVGIIILGAIGSGLWAELLSPLWNMLTDGIIKLFSLASASFTNMIYFGAAKGFHEVSSLGTYTLLVSITIGLFVYLIIVFRKLSLERKRTSGKDEKVNEKWLPTRGQYLFIASCYCFCIVILIFNSIRLSYINKVTTNSLNSISIVAPHIGIQQTLELRSMFYSIETSDDYNDFYEKLRKLEETFKLKLPVSAPL